MNGENDVNQHPCIQHFLALLLSLSVVATPANAQSTRKQAQAALKEFARFIGNENEQYREQIIQLKANVDRLKHQNEALRSRREGMKIGALIAFGGIVIGLVAPMLRRRRRGGSWDSL